MDLDGLFSVPDNRQSLGGSCAHGLGERLLRDWLHTCSCSFSMMRAVHFLVETKDLQLNDVSGKERGRSEKDWRFSGIKGNR